MATRSAFLCVFGSAMLVAVVALVSTFERTNAAPKVLASQSAEVIQTSGTGNRHLLAKQSYEDHWRAKIERAVGFIPGVVVTVDVTLSPETIYWEKSLAHNESPIVSETVSKRTLCRSENAESSIVSNLAAELSPRPFETPHVDRTIERALFLPEAVTVAISAPRGYLRQILRSRGEGEEDNQTLLVQFESELTGTIEEIAVALIPKAPPGEDTFPRVTVIWHEELGAERGTP